jgi:uncharacterized protein (TIGR03067 family)
MRKTSLLFAVVAFAGLAPDAKEDAAKKELEALQGTWAVVSAVRDGKEILRDEFKDIRLSYTGAKATVRKGDKVLFEGTIRLDPTKKPKLLDSTQLSDGEEKGKTFLGIYELNGDNLKICSSTPAGKAAPADFGSRPGSGHFLRVYKREKK